MGTSVFFVSIYQPKKGYLRRWPIIQKKNLADSYDEKDKQELPLDEANERDENRRVQQNRLPIFHES